MKIMLVAVDAQYFHTNLAVRSVAAYARQVGGVETEIIEFTINQRQSFLLEEIYQKKPDVLLFSCYIWNIEMITALAKELRKLLPTIFIAAGGPQVSYHCGDFLRQNPAFDALLVGEGELASLELFKALQSGVPLEGVAGLVFKQWGQGQREQHQEQCQEQHQGQHQEQRRKQYQEQYQEQRRGQHQEQRREQCREQHQEQRREQYREQHQGQRREQHQGQRREQHQGQYQEQRREQYQEQRREQYQEQHQEQYQGQHQEERREQHQEQYQIITNPKPRPLVLDEIPFAYSEGDLGSGRILYYESMRGCPFGCSYCLSSVEQGVRFKNVGLVYEDLARFLAARPKQVKFVDRTFNCNKAHAMGIWRFLQQHDNGVTNFHFELAGELLDDESITFLNKVRPGLFQFEIGVQSTNIETLEEIDRPANLGRLFANMAKLQAPQNIHLHVDLIAGLPYEGFDSFVRSFHKVYAQKPNQFQLGFLKVLAGSGMEQNAPRYGLVWQDTAPFEVLFTNWLDFDDLLVLKGVAEMVERYYNSGRFAYLVGYLCAQFETPFTFYHQLAQFYLGSGAAVCPLSKMGYYQLLGDFMKSAGIPQTEHIQWLCKLDLALHEKIRTLPSWVTVDETRARREDIVAFYAEAANRQAYLPEYAGRDPKQISKMAHIEILPFNPVTGLKGECALLFNYKQRDIDGRAKMWEIKL